MKIALKRIRCGFTLVELLVVMAIVATLLSLVAPKYFASIDRSKEVALKTNLRLIRDALDKHYADTGHYPDRLDRLVKQRYLREVPIDPVTERSDTWVPIEHPNRLPGIYDIRSGASGMTTDGVDFGTL
jgi:general secretion pathway protein G